MAEMTPADSTPARPRGRPRDDAINAAAIAAVLDLLANDGVGAVTIEAVAKRIGTTRPALYRRWPNAQDLLWDALERALLQATNRSDFGPPYSVAGLGFEAALRQAMKRYVDVFSDRRFAACYLAVMTAAQRDSALRSDFDRYNESFVVHLAAALHRQPEAHHAPVELITHMAVGVIAYEILIRGVAPSGDMIDSIASVMTAGCRGLAAAGAAAL